MMDTEFYTATMARVYAQQGHYEKAAEIYRPLLKREPDRRDWVEALAHVEEQCSTQGPKSDADLVPMFRKWIRLVLQYRHIRRLKKDYSNLSS